VQSDVDKVVSDVQQMSLESIDMTQEVAMPVPMYTFMPDPNLLPGNFIDPAAMQHPGLQHPFLDVNFAADQHVGTASRLDSGDFPATIDGDLWSQLTPRVDDYGTFDATDFSDLMVFHRIEEIDG